MIRMEREGPEDGKEGGGTEEDKGVRGSSVEFERLSNNEVSFNIRSLPMKLRLEELLAHQISLSRVYLLSKPRCSLLAAMI